MPSATSKAPHEAVDDLDNYGIDDDGADIFASPTPPGSASQKKADGGLGIDKEVDVKTRARAPAVKLDEERLLGEAGIPTLRKRARNLKLKGKGHEFSDAARLLTFYQLWLDDLYPKAKFRDALAMVEKAGHKKRLAMARAEWLNEHKPKSADKDDDLDLPTLQDGQRTPTQGVPPEDDIYGSTPQANRARPPTTGRLISQSNGMPDDDDLDALMAEAEEQDTGRQPSRPAAGGDDEDMDDLDAMMAESEAHANSAPKAAPAAAPRTSFDDEEEAMREMDDMW